MVESDAAHRSCCSYTSFLPILLPATEDATTNVYRGRGRHCDRTAVRLQAPRRVCCRLLRGSSMLISLKTIEARRQVAEVDKELNCV